MKAPRYLTVGFTIASVGDTRSYQATLDLNELDSIAAGERRFDDILRDYDRIISEAIQACHARDAAEVPF